MRSVKQWVVGSALLTLIGVIVTGGGAGASAQGTPPGYVGVRLGDLTAQESVEYGIKGPGVVAAVIANGPAYKSGLRDDDAITTIDGKKVASAAEATALLNAHKVGDKVRIGLVHLQGNGKRFEIEIGVVVEPRPAGYGVNSFPQTQGAPAGQSAPPAAGGQAPGSGATRPGARPAAGGTPTGGVRYVDLQTAPQGSPQRQGSCAAVVPQGWAMRSGADGATADLDGPGGLSHASWGILGVNTAMRASYGDLYGPPDLSALTMAGMVSKSPARYTSQSSLVGGYFTARKFETATAVGSVLYHVYPASTPGYYIISVFLAWSDRSAAAQLPVAEAVMVSINCQTKLRPVPNTPPPGPGGGTRGARSEDDHLKDYNAQTGKQWATSSTGRHYLLDYASQWNDNGPDGAGYYSKSGNSWEKLTPGWK